MARRPPPQVPLSEAVSSEDLDANELRFVDEYLIDRDPTAAALRAGVARINLKKKVQQWMGDPRIARAIQFKTDGADLDKMISPQRIMAGFIDVAFDRSAPPAARNTALRELAAMKKMYGEEDKDKKGSGVVFIPGMAAIGDWDSVAQKMQAKLKDDVKN